MMETSPITMSQPPKGNTSLSSCIIAFSIVLVAFGMGAFFTFPHTAHAAEELYNIPSLASDTYLNAYYRFEEASGTAIVDTKNGVNGTLGGATINQTGEFGKAYYFNDLTGSNGDTFPSSTAWQAGTNDMSIVFWFKAPSQTTYGTAIIGSTQSWDATARFGIKYNWTGWSSSYANQISPAYWDGSSMHNLISGTLANDTWYHIAFVRSGDTAKLYVNGLEMDSQTGWAGYNLTLAKSGYQMTLGWWGPDSDQIKMYLDDLAFFSRALSKTEINELYNNPFALSISSTTQYRSDGVTALKEGEVATSSNAVFGAFINSGSTNNVSLEVQVQPTGYLFDNTTVSTSSPYISPNTSTTVTYSGSDGRYHWEAMAVDTAGNTSTWQTFGINATSTTDFAIDTTPGFSGELFSSPLFGDSDLVSYYRMQVGPEDYKDNNNGQDSNVIYGTTDGRFGAGASFNGSNSTISTDYSYGGNISISFWVKLAADTLTPGQDIALVEVGSPTNYIEHWVSYYNNGGTKQLVFDRLRQNVANDTAVYNITLGTTTWYHIVYTYDGSTVRGYVNGSLVQSVASTGNGASGTVWPFALSSYNTIAWSGGPVDLNGSMDDVSIFSRALSASEVASLYHGSSLYLTSPQQYKSDATTTISEGATTTESTVVFGANLASLGTSTLQLQVEVKPAGTGFADIPNASSSPVSPGSFATTTFSSSTAIDPSVYPRDPESWSNGSFHWQARAYDTVTGATSSWQSPTAGDFTINTVPLYMQKHGPYPSYASTTDWHDDLYDGSSTIDCYQGAGITSTIGYCGCSITSAVMWLRYNGITTDTLGEDVNPGTLNAWLTNTGEYTSQGDFTWDPIERYASSSSGGAIVFDEDSPSYDGSSISTLRSLVDAKLSSSTPNPVILKENANNHFVLATGFATTAGTSTYTTRDSAYYNTRYLNQTMNTSSEIYGYSNNIDGVRIYYDPIALPQINTYAIDLPNALMLIDSQGRRTGKDPVTDVSYHEVPGTTYFEEGHSGQLHFSDPPIGQYTLYVLGGQTGQYNLDSWVDDGGPNPPRPQRISGDIRVGSMVAYWQNYNPANVVSSTLSFKEVVSSTASITSAPPHNLPLPPAP
jgi:hypothetical protein